MLCTLAEPGSVVHEPQNYEEFTSRNAVLLAPDLQERIRTAEVLLVGCGLASRIAEMACRLGFTRFRLWDGDRVELSNLNRQAFSRKHLGWNKAEATADLLRGIHPEVCCRVEPRRLEMADIDAALDGVDLVVNTADFDDVVYAVGDQAVERGISCVFTLNLGFGGACVMFTPQSARLATLTGGVTDNDEQFLLALGQRLHGFQPSARFRALIPEFLQESARRGYFPQNVVASSITAALACHALVRLLEGPVPAAPQLLHLDPDTFYE